MKSIKYLILLAGALGMSTTQPMGAFNWGYQKYRDYRVEKAISNSNLSNFTHSFDAKNYDQDQLKNFLNDATSAEERRSADKRENENNTYSITNFLKGIAKESFAFIPGILAWVFYYKFRVEQEGSWLRPTNPPYPVFASLGYAVYASGRSGWNDLRKSFNYNVYTQAKYQEAQNIKTTLENAAPGTKNRNFA